MQKPVVAVFQKKGGMKGHCAPLSRKSDKDCSGSDGNCKGIDHNLRGTDPICLGKNMKGRSNW